MKKTDMAEVRRVVALQTDAFHTTAPLPLLDGMAKRFFEAEVLSGEPAGSSCHCFAGTSQAVSSQRGRKCLQLVFGWLGMSPSAV